MNYPKKTGFNPYQSRHCAYITCSMKTGFKNSLRTWETWDLQTELNCSTATKPENSLIPKYSQ